VASREWKKHRVSGQVEIDAAIGLSRYFPASATADAARAFEASGVIDGITMWDQMMFFHPPSLWTEKNTPMLAVMPDLDSFVDPFASLGYAACAAPSLNLSLGTDAVRRSPGELAQSMLTLSAMTTGTVTVQLGAGEIKQCRPFGCKRSQGLRRTEDMLRLLRAQFTTREPIDFTGNHWTFDTAFIGNAQKDRPLRIWGLGGGPRLIDITTSYADGFTTAAPFVATNPARWAEIIEQLKGQLVAKDRDPDAFDFGLFPACCLIHEDENVLDRALENPLIRWVTAIMGRINQADSERDGIAPPLPADWHYAMKLLPYRIGAAEAEEMMSGVTREMVERSWIIGAPAEVANHLRGFVEVGTTWRHIGDLTPLVLDPADAAESGRRVIEIAQGVKGAP
jgi:phthiodiolone/phenolphthiodiolone dimycocerosates ketoreductase